MTNNSIFTWLNLHSDFLLLQWISVPFALSNPAVSDIGVTAKKAIYQSPWLGKIEPEDNWLWADNFFLLVSHNLYLKFHQETVYCIILKSISDTYI